VGVVVTTLTFTDEQRRALSLQIGGPNDWDTRCKRFSAFEDRAFETMKRAILAGDITDAVVLRVERNIIEILKTMPETQAEMILYTRDIEVSVSGSNYRKGWPWRRYTAHKNMHVDFIFGPYKSSISAWTDPAEPGGVVRFQ
jgi:hypothetical protein